MIDPEFFVAFIYAHLAYRSFLGPQVLFARTALAFLILGGVEVSSGTILGIPAAAIVGFLGPLGLSLYGVMLLVDSAWRLQRIADRLVENEPGMKQKIERAREQARHWPGPGPKS